MPTPARSQPIAHARGTWAHMCVCLCWCALGHWSISVSPFVCEPVANSVDTTANCCSCLYFHCWCLHCIVCSLNWSFGNEIWIRCQMRIYKLIYPAKSIKTWCEHVLVRNYYECHPQGKSKHVFKLFVYHLITLIKGNTCGWIRIAVIISPKASKNHLCKKQSWSYEIEVRSVDLSIECRLVSIKWNVLYLTPFAHKYTHTHIQ